MDVLILIPFLVQMVAIGFDEIFFHLKRDLPKWERLGHPIDTLAVLCCFIFIQAFPFSPGTLKMFIALAIFSSLLITKDEFVHKHHCPKEEMWLHALLFVNHSVLLTALGLIWSEPVWLERKQFFQIFLKIQTIGITLFMLYQIVYWNFVRKEHAQENQ